MSRFARRAAFAAALWAGSVVAARATPPPQGDAVAAARNEKTVAASAIDPAHAARVERLIEVSRFPTILDASFAIADDALSRDDPDAEAMRTLVGFAAWRNSAGLWRKAIARGLSVDEAERAIAYYESAGGIAVVACQTSASGPQEIVDCLQTLPDEHQRSYADFAATPAGRALGALIQQVAPQVMKQATCEGLAREPRMIPRLDAICRRETRSICNVIRRRSRGDSAEIDAAVCDGAIHIGE